MLYSKRRKNLGGGRRKRSNRRSNRTRIRGGSMAYDDRAAFEYYNNLKKQEKERETELRNWCESMGVTYNNSSVNMVHDVVNAVSAFKAKGFSINELKSAGFTNDTLIAAGFKELIPVQISYVPKTVRTKSDDTHFGDRMQGQ
jgi:hypothetical protein